MSSSLFAGYLPSFGSTLSGGDAKVFFKALQKLEYFTSLSPSGGTSRWITRLAQFPGFDNHLFDYNRLSGLFYFPYSDDVISPIAVLSGELN